MKPCVIRESARGFERTEIEDELFKAREIFLTEEVNPHTMSEIIKQIMYLSRDDPNKEITIYINSPGGEVQSGLAVYDFLKTLNTPIHTVCIGIAASMGAILFLAGDRREMLPHSQIMIHDPSMGQGNMQGVKPAEMEESLKSLQKTQSVLCDIISETTGKSLTEVRKKTRKDSYFDADEAVKFGLATEIKSLERRLSNNEQNNDR